MTKRAPYVKPMTDEHFARLASIREPIERRLIYSLADNSFSDVSRAWLQAGQSLAANCGDYGAICDMASMVENAARQWRAEANDPDGVRKFVNKPKLQTKGE